MKFVQKTLKNGVRAIVAPMPESQTVTVLVLVGTGSNYETRKISGISHFLEHMFFKGTKKHAKSGEISRIMDSVGAAHNAFTSREETGYWVKLERDKFDFGLDVVSDILQNSLLEEGEIDRERGVILEEMNMYFDMPQRQIWSELELLLYGDNPYGWDVIGFTKNIQTLKRKDFLSYWKKQYTASNTVVVVAGGIPENTTMDHIEKSFSSLRKGVPGKPMVFKKNTDIARVRAVEKNTDQSHILIGTEGYKLTHKDKVAADVLATILGGYSSSRLFRDIRDTHGLAYAVHASHNAYAYGGYFAAYVGVPHQKRVEVIERIIDHLSKIKKNGVTKEELSRAKANARGKLAMSLEATDEVAGFLGGQELILGKIRSPEEILKKIEQVEREDITRVATQMFQPSKIRIATIGPEQDEALYATLIQKV